MATVIDPEDDRVNLVGLYDRVARGEEIVLERNGGPKLKLVVDRESRPVVERRFGTLKGKIKLDDSFFDPLPEAELRAWEGG